MNSSRVGNPLSRRLSKLKSYHESETHIWDIGCDHGDLGLSFVSNEAVEVIHLVDPSNRVISELNKKLKDSYITKPALFIQKMNGQLIKIKEKKNLIFIAGMGGKEISEIVLSLLPQLDRSSKLVLSPHKNILELRALLHRLPLSLISEDLVFENDQFYQMIVLRPDDSKDRIKVSLYGSMIWRCEYSKQYRDHLLKHFSSHRGDLSKDFVNYLNSLTF